MKKQHIVWSAVAIAALWGIAYGLSSALNCVPCTDFLTAQKSHLPPVYQTDEAPAVAE